MLFVKKFKVDEVLVNFPAIESYMKALAREKSNYSLILQDAIVKRYEDPRQSKDLIKKRMESETITTYMSLKRQMKRKKENEVTARNLQENGQDNREKVDELRSRLPSFVDTDLPGRLQGQELGQNPHTQDYSDNMLGLINKDNEDELEGSNNKNNNFDDGYQGDDPTEDDDAINLRIVEVMRESENYFESNMNGFCNNMALNSVNAIEIGTIMEGFYNDTKETVRVVANAEDHMKFTAQKSKALLQRL